MVVVKQQKGESTDRLISRFKKKVINTGLLRELRDKQRFTSKGEKKKDKKSRIKHQIELEKKRNR